jgi:hypothetical protein
MRLRLILFLILILAGIGSLNAQSARHGAAADSVKIVKRMQELLYICRNIDFGDPKTGEIGTFYKAAPYIAYRGENKMRAWKDTVNYRNPGERKAVDDICFKINQTLNQDTAYKILKYITQTEPDGVWHVIFISYKRKGVEKKIVYAFLKIKGNYMLADIEEQ